LENVHMKNEGELGKSPEELSLVKT
jgi:hypothetical protein